MENAKKPIEIAKELTVVNVELFTIIDKLNSYGIDFGLAPQNIRDATINIHNGITKVLEQIEKKDEAE